MVALQLSNESLATLYCDKRQQGQFQLSNGNLQIVCFYGTFFNVVVPGNGHSRCSFLWHAMCIRPSLKLGHTAQSTHYYPNNTPIFYSLFFQEILFLLSSLKIKFQIPLQDLNHSYNKSPPKKYYGLEQNFGQRRTSSSQLAREQPLLSRNGKIF